MKYLKRQRATAIYFRDELNDEDVCSGIPKDDSDVGKYYHFKDGSDWCAKILAVRDSYFRTEIGLHRKDDLVIQSTVYFPGTNYAGCFNSELSFRINPPSRHERTQLREIFKNNKYPKVVTDRLRRMIIDKLREALNESGVDEKWITDRLMAEADNMKNRGSERISAIQIIARIHGIETEKMDNKGYIQNNTQVNFTGQKTIQDMRREELPNMSLLKQCASMLIARELPEEVSHVVENSKYPLFPGTYIVVDKQKPARLEETEIIDV